MIVGIQNHAQALTEFLMVRAIHTLVFSFQSKMYIPNGNKDNINILHMVDTSVQGSTGNS